MPHSSHYDAIVIGSSQGGRFLPFSGQNLAVVGGSGMGRYTAADVVARC